MIIKRIQFLVIAVCFSHGGQLNIQADSQFAPFSTKQMILNDMLIKAASKGNKALVEILICHGAHIHAKDDNGDTCITKAAFFGHEAIVLLLLNKGADKNAANIWGCTPLIYAARNWNSEVLRLLLKSGVDMDKKDYKGRTALIFAAMNGDEVAVQSLLEADTTINIRNNLAWDILDALRFAIAYWHTEVVRLLMHHKIPGKQEFAISKQAAEDILKEQVSTEMKELVNVEIRQRN